MDGQRGVPGRREATYLGVYQEGYTGAYTTQGIPGSTYWTYTTLGIPTGVYWVIPGIPTGVYWAIHGYTTGVYHRVYLFSPQGVPLPHHRVYLSHLQTLGEASAQRGACLP